MLPFCFSLKKLQNLRKRLNPKGVDSIDILKKQKKLKIKGNLYSFFYFKKILDNVFLIC